jgi:radical SAM superfamily enzyme YgiQ (UPF0313 family)
MMQPFPSGSYSLALTHWLPPCHRLSTMHVLLMSTYELGRQPLHVASPAAAIIAAGHDVRAIDLAVQPWDAALITWADAIAISTPMHTATRIAVGAANRVRRQSPDLPIAAYGLYAAMAGDGDSAGVFDRAIVGEYESALVEWLAGAPFQSSVSVHLGRGGFRVPDRSVLPPLAAYARLAVGNELRLVGAVEASHGCAYKCRHCPIPAVYDGTFRIIDVATVLSDIDSLVAAGARHITFGDPDFLNGPAHSLRVVRGLHESHPEVTFDCTVKVEHILRHRDLWPEFAAAGCLFVVSAFESTNDDVLRLLDKGHTVADAANAVAVLRDAGIDVRPSWLPFTPWATRSDIDEMFRFIAVHDLFESTDPIQMGIRLLIPHGSLVLDIGGIDRYLGTYDPEALSYEWTADDHAMDELAAHLTKIAKDGSASDTETSTTLMNQWLAVVDGTELEAPAHAIDHGATSGRPQLTESWF